MIHRAASMSNFSSWTDRDLHRGIATEPHIAGAHPGPDCVGCIATDEYVAELLAREEFNRAQAALEAGNEYLLEAARQRQAS